MNLATCLENNLLLACVTSITSLIENENIFKQINTWWCHTQHI